MSSENLNENATKEVSFEKDMIQDIDDASQQEYIETLAPKAQEESDIINQDGDSSVINEHNIQDKSQKINEESIPTYENVQETHQDEEKTEESYVNIEKIDENRGEEEVEVNKDEEENHVEEKIGEEKHTEEEIDEQKQVQEEIEEQKYVQEEIEEEKHVSVEIEEEKHVSEEIEEEKHVAEEIEEENHAEIKDDEEKLVNTENSEESNKESSNHTNEEHEDIKDENHAADKNVEERFNNGSNENEEQSEVLNISEEVCDQYSVDVDHQLEINAIDDNVEHSYKKVEAKDVNNVSQANEKVLEDKRSKDIKALSNSYNNEDNVNFDCEICNKTVYPLEKVSANNHIFHKQCFRCNKCRCALLAGNFSFNNDKPYCRPHYIELFKKRGRYDEIDDAEVTTQQMNINDIITDELPAQDITKNLVAKFRDFEAGSGASVISATNTDELPAPNTTKNLTERFSALGKDSGKNDQKRKPMIEIPRAEESGDNKGGCENDPIILPKDVARSNEPGQDEMPVQGITKNLVNRFRDLESTGVSSK